MRFLVSQSGCWVRQAMANLHTPLCKPQQRQMDWIPNHSNRKKILPSPKKEPRSLFFDFGGIWRSQSFPVPPGFVYNFALSCAVDAGSGQAASLLAPAGLWLQHWGHDTMATMRVLCQEFWVTSAMRSRTSINLSVSSNGIYVVKGDEALLPWNCEPAREGFLLCEGLIS